MRHRAEFNRFAIFFCSLIPLGSLAIKAISEESNSTAGQLQENFTTRLKPLAWMTEREATKLFKNYNVCSSVSPRTASWLSAVPQAEDMVKKIPECPAFDSNCCTFHIFYNALQSLRSEIESICGKQVTVFVDGNLNQLQVTLIERAALYNCSKQDLPRVEPSLVQRMKMAEKKMYIWRVLEKYETYMKNTTKLYSSTEM